MGNFKKSILPFSVAIFLFFFTFYHQHAGNNSIQFKHISVKQDLSLPTVLCVFQCSRGFIWIGTENGLNRFDGYEMKIYKNDPQDKFSISDNYVRCILEDKDGYLWIGTRYGGLNRFDPRMETFKHYKKTNDEKGLSHNAVRALFLDDQEMLWICTMGGGLSCFDRNESFIHYMNEKDDANSLSHNYATSIFKDRYGTLWVGCFEGGLNKFNEENGSFSHFTKKNSNLSDDAVNCIYEDRSGVLWVGTFSGGLNRFDRESETFTSYLHKDGDDTSLSDNSVYCIFEDRDKTLWIGTRSGGVNCYNREKDCFIHYKHAVYDSQSLSNNFVISIYQDETGLLWFGTYGGGVNTYNPNNINNKIYQHDPTKEDSLSNNQVYCICEDRSGALWIGTTGGGLNKFDRKSETFTRYTKTNSGLNDNNVTAICEDHTGVLWIGTTNGGINRLEPETTEFTHYIHKEGSNSLSNNSVMYILEDSKRLLWIATDGGGLNLLNPKTGHFTHYRSKRDEPFHLSYDWVTTIYEDTIGKIWIGTNDGLNCFDRNSGKFEVFRHNKGEGSLSSSAVFSIIEDSNGQLWFGTFNGLNKFNRESKTFIVYNKKNGLWGDFVGAIANSGSNNLWLNTNRGISNFKLDKKKFKNYEVDGFFLDIDRGGTAFIKLSTGEMAYGGSKGFFIFSPKNVVRDQQESPPVVITDFLLNNSPIQSKRLEPRSPLERPIYETEALTLTHYQNIFSFKFAVLHYANPKLNQYQYQLEGSNDPQWKDTDAKNRLITYANIPAGDYVFRVRGSNKHGIVDKEGASIKIRILPPWWNTVWFAFLITLLFIIALGSFFFVLWRKITHERSVSNRLEELNRLKDDFLSNTSHELRTPLNGIIGIAESLISGVAGKLPPRVCSDLSQIINCGKRLAHLVNDLLDFSRLKDQRLKLEKKPVDIHSIADVVMRVLNPLIGNKDLKLINAIKPDVPFVEADENRLQQMLFNLIGNAIKFTDSGTITVSADAKDSMMYISVADTGIGIPKEKFEQIFKPFEQVEDSSIRFYEGTGIGLAITRKLVELHKGRLDVNSSVGKGSTFRFSLPLSNEEVMNISEPEPFQKEIPVFEEYTHKDFQLESVSPEVILPPGKFHILVVDDEPINRQVIRNFLELQNCLVSDASNGEDALRILRNGIHYDLVILDVMMPRMSGYEVCRKIRKMYNVSELPIIFLTARNQDSDIIAAINEGGNDFVSKPVSKGELLARVKSQLQLIEAQNLLIHSEKMVSLGTLVAGVAHELNNPTAAIEMSATYFSRIKDEILQILDHYYKLNKNIEIAHLPYEEVKKEIIRLTNALLENSIRIKRIVQDLRVFSRREGRSDKKLVDINEIIQSSIKLTGKLIEESTQNFSCELGEGMPLLLASFQKLEQVIINLIINACQALPDNSRGICISSCYIKEKEEVIIIVKDEGDGILDENVKHLTEPFFTTKRDKGGTGLGLWVSYRIIQGYDGILDFKSNKATGTIVSVHLPVNVRKEQ